MKAPEVSSTTNIPLDLLHLIKHCGEAFFGDKSINARDVFENDIHRIHKEYGTSSNPVIIEALLACWIPYIKYIALVALVPKYYAPAMNEMVDILAKNKLALEIATKDSERERLIALLCLTRVYVVDGNTRGHPISNNVATVLHHWSGRPVEAGTIYSLEKTVNTLYGPACWSLYRDEVESDSLLPEHLYNLSLPLTGVQRAQAQEEQMSVPIDLA